jgi:DNA processing protein
MSREIESAIILQLLPGIGSSGTSRLRQQLGTFSQILNTSSAQLPTAWQQALRLYRRQRDGYRDRARAIIEFCAANQITIVADTDAAYPDLLRETHSSPPLLYVKGNPEILNLPQIAIVGSRNPTAAGAANANAFAEILGASGFVITSGMALGIDAAAHSGAMSQGLTIAVLGTGIDVIYPRQHTRLYHSIIAQGGAIVSEFLPGTPGRASNFPQRNRLISGLSLGVLVVEAALRSGSLITARHAMQQGREVFALPGSIHSPLSRGCHQLIRAGASLVETAQDIVDELGGMLSYIAQRPDKPLTLSSLDAEENGVLLDLDFDFVDLDTLINRTGFSAGKLTGILTRLELQGLLESRNGLYCRLHPTERS